MKHVEPAILDNYANEIAASSQDAMRYREIAIIKEKGTVDENVNLNMNFLGLDLSDVPTQNYKDWKVYVIPALYVITSIISTSLTMNTNKKSKEEKLEETEEPKEKEQDAMEEMNKQMKFMMPIMTVSIALIAPLGLALYWFVSNLLMICERLVINKVVKEEEDE